MLYLTVLFFPSFSLFLFFLDKIRGKNPSYFVKKNPAWLTILHFCPPLFDRGLFSDLNDNGCQLGTTTLVPSQDTILNIHVQSPLLLSLTFEMKRPFFHSIQVHCWLHLLSTKDKNVVTWQAAINEDC